MENSKDVTKSKISEMETKDVSRRSFIGTTGKVVAAGVLGHFLLVGSTKAEESSPNKLSSNLLRTCGACDKCNKCEDCNECQKCFSCQLTCQKCDKCQVCDKVQHE